MPASARRTIALLVAGSAAVTICVAAAGARTPRAVTFVQLRTTAPRSARVALRRAGAGLAVPALDVWRFAPGADMSVLARLRTEGAVAFVQPERTYTVAAVPSDPLSGSEYWRTNVHVDTLEPPGPGVPVTLVDSGVYFGHQEFAGRPNLIALDSQEPAPIGGVHGTAVASVVGAPVNGVGLVGIYPQAVIRSYDASLGDGTQLPDDEIARGIVAAAGAGRSVINLSLGGDQPDRLIDAAVTQAVRAGSLVVAASASETPTPSDVTFTESRLRAGSHTL